MRVNGAEQVHPLARHANESLIHVPGRRSQLDRTVQSPIDLGTVCLDQRQMEVWSTARPRSAMSSSKSRRLSQNRRYQRTQVTITCGSNLRFQKKGGPQDP